LVLFSSLTASTGGGPGQVDYIAANAFLDAYAQRNWNRHGTTLAIGWGEWQWNTWEDGLNGYDTATRHRLREHRQQFGISFAEGTEAFARLLTARQPQVIFSTQDYQQFTKFLRAFTTTGPGSAALREGQARPAYPRPTLASSYTPP